MCGCKLCIKAIARTVGGFIVSPQSTGDREPLAPVASEQDYRYWRGNAAATFENIDSAAGNCSAADAGKRSRHRAPERFFAGGPVSMALDDLSHPRKRQVLAPK